MTPRPPALETAAARSGPAATFMPASMMGCLSPKSSVRSVRMRWGEASAILSEYARGVWIRGRGARSVVCRECSDYAEQSWGDEVKRRMEEKTRMGWLDDEVWREKPSRHLGQSASLAPLCGCECHRQHSGSPGSRGQGESSQQPRCLSLSWFSPTLESRGRCTQHTVCSTCRAE